MGIHPKQYSRENFFSFLNKNNVSETIIDKFVDLPETVLRNENRFELYINITWYNIDDTHYNFELNYYSEELIEFLFTSKVFNDIEVSLNYLLCELIEKGYIKGKKIC